MLLSSTMNSNKLRHNEQCNDWNQRLLTSVTSVARPLDCSAKPTLKSQSDENILGEDQQFPDKIRESFPPNITFPHPALSYAAGKFNAPFHIRNTVFSKAFGNTNFCSATKANFNSCVSKSVELASSLVLPNNPIKCENSNGNLAKPHSFKHDRSDAIASLNDDWMMIKSINCDLRSNNNTNNKIRNSSSSDISF